MRTRAGSAEARSAASTVRSELVAPDGAASVSTSWRPRWVEVVMAAVLLTMGGLSTPAITDGAPAAAVLVLLCLAAAGAVLIRRARPGAAVTLLGLVCVVHTIVFPTLSIMALAACLVAVETAASRVSRPGAWVLLAAGYAGGPLAVVVVDARAATGPLPLQVVLQAVGMSWLFMTVALLAGLLRRRSRERRAQAAERLGMLLAQQEMETRLAVAEERSRIAREVHDVVGHSLAVIAMQAEGARAVLSRDPARADAAMAVIGTTSRAAVEEVRALVDVLRSDEERRDGVPTAPGERAAAAAPGHDHGDGGPDAGSTGPESLDALVPLVAGLRGAGVRVGLRLSLGEETRVGSAVEDCLVRVAREAVTNALHHAEGARLALRVTASGATAEVEVLNGPGGRDALPSTGRAGTGLASMRERVEAMGGLLEAGPVEDGGWRVRARVPVTGTTGAGGRA